MASAASDGASLYRRLGGYDVVAAFTDNWLGRVVADPALAGYFKGMSNDTKRKARQLIVDFVAASTGGPTLYTGRDMKTLHEGLGITRGEYVALLAHAATTLDEVGVAGRAKEDLLAWLATLESDVVEPA